MSLAAAFWDASAIVPLCVEEPTTNHAQSLAENITIVVWWSTVVEIQSAIAQRFRLGHLDGISGKSALDRLFALRQYWQEILPGFQVRDKAAELLHIHPLRAADSLQLAAALIWCNQRPAGRKLIASDTRLCEAASLSGFEVVRPAIY